MTRDLALQSALQSVPLRLMLVSLMLLLLVAGRAWASVPSTSRTSQHAAFSPQPSDSGFAR